MPRDFLEPHSKATSARPESTLPGPHPRPAANGRSQRYPSGRIPAFPPPDGTNVLLTVKFPHSVVSAQYLEASSRAYREAATNLLIYQSDFDADTVVQARAFLRYFHRFIQSCRLQQNIAGNALLGLSERAVHHLLSLLSGNNFTLFSQRLTGFGLSLLSQSIEPGNPSAHDILDFFRRQVLVPMHTAKQ